MRRFRLEPVSVGAGGFRQTIILPPPSGPQAVIVEVPAPGGDCTGVADPPELIEVTAFAFACGPNQTPWQYTMQAASLPAGYAPAGPVGGPADPPDAACLETEPTGWLIVRECDNATLTIPINVTYEGGA